ncbi:MAG: tetratricopeptide repeat-containing sensor histidine kinase [Prolixibacteraceae bacterium]|jgi:signal transduction histidine kinase/predicted negative regulator of RcsB-dependent stress response|nr:tetratricopeptide repeat-containing sensor histidine kinase [Prolixibacteraceae bacterium]
MVKPSVYLLFSLALNILVHQYSFSDTPSGRKIYFENATIDARKFKNDLKKFVELNKTNFDSLLYECHNLMKQSKKINFKWGLFIANFEISYAHLRLGSIDSAIYYANETLKIAEFDTAPEWLANAHRRMGSCYEATDDHEKAMYHFLEAEKIARANNLRDILIDVMNYKGDIFRKIKDYKTALRHFNSIQEEFKDSLTAFDNFRIINNIANVYYDQNLRDRALNYFRDAKEYALQTGDSIHIALADQNLGTTFFHLNRFDEAKQHIDKAIPYFKKVNDHATLEILYRSMGCIQSRKGNHAEAEQNFLKSLMLARQLKNFRKLADNYANMASNFYFWKIKEPGNMELLKKENACLHYAIIYKDSLYNIETNKTIHEIERKYEIEKKNAQITLLEKETEIQKDRQMFMFAGMGILVLVMGILAVSFQYVKKTNRVLLHKNQRIEVQKAQIQVQNRQLEISVNTQNKLFSIIAHDLRSPLASISNIGVLLKMAFDQKDDKMTEDLIDKLIQRNDQVIQLTDNLLNWAGSQTGKIRFIPARLNLKTILQETMSLFEENLNQKNIRIEMDVPGNMDIFADNSTIKTVFRNLINNAVKFTHNGGLISIRCKTENQNAIIQISDNGIGIPEYIQNIIFDVTDKKQQTGTWGEKSTGLGLVVCKEFIERNNGHVWFESTEGKGSNFYISIPLYINETAMDFEA